MTPTQLTTKTHRNEVATVAQVIGPNNTTVASLNLPPETTDDVLKKVAEGMKTCGTTMYYMGYHSGKDEVRTAIKNAIGIY